MAQSQLAALLSQPAAPNPPTSVTSRPSQIRELPATSTPADLTNSEQPAHANSTTTPPVATNLSGQDDNPTSTSADDGASTEQTAPSTPEEVASSPPLISNEPTDITEPDDVTATPAPANDNNPVEDLHATGTE